MNREEVAMDVTVQNVEILRGRLEQAKHYLTYFVDNEENHEENLAQRHMMHEEARQFLASQQGEQTIEERNEAILWKFAAWVDDDHTEQAEGAQGERDHFEAAYAAEFCQARGVSDFTSSILVEMRTGDTYGERPYLNGQWKGWQARAALAHPSPKCVACEDLPAEQNNPCAVCGKSAQPSPAPELERPEVVATVKTMGFGRLYAEGFGEPIDKLKAGDELMAVAQHDRIVGALRAERDMWMQAAGRSREEVIAYIAERANLLEQVAQAGQVPEGWKPSSELLRQVEALGCDIANCAGTNNRTGARDKIDQLLKLLAAAPAQGE